jgi:hypothetical protein
MVFGAGVRVDFTQKRDHFLSDPTIVCFGWQGLGEDDWCRS